MSSILCGYAISECFLHCESWPTTRVSNLSERTLDDDARPDLTHGSERLMPLPMGCGASCNTQRRLIDTLQKAEEMHQRYNNAQTMAVLEIRQLFETAVMFLAFYAAVSPTPRKLILHLVNHATVLVPALKTLCVLHRSQGPPRFYTFKRLLSAQPLSWFSMFSVTAYSVSIRTSSYEYH